MSTQIDALTAAVAQNTTVIESAITLMGGLKTQLDAAIAELSATGNTTALAQLSTDLTNESQKLAAAIAANTPAAPPAA